MGCRGRRLKPSHLDKKTHKNQDVTAVFIPISERGSNGELRRNNPVKYFLKARRNLHAGLFL